MTDASDGGSPGSGQPGRRPAVLGALSVALLFAVLCRFSWEKWADPIVDFGNELYLAWRLYEGDQLYRDIAYRHGPLSHYVNASWFAALGVEIRSLVIANLAIFAAICGLVFRLIQRARGTLAATLAGWVLVGIFGFGQYVSIGNYNYVTPYQHAQTHALLLSLLMISALAAADAGRPIARWLFAGGCLGLVFLTKIELFIPAAVTAAVGLGILVHSGRATPVRIVGFLLASVAPFAIALALLSRAMPFELALRGALGNWSQLGASGAVLGDAFYIRGSGFDDPLANLARMLAAALGIGLFGAGAAALDRRVASRRPAVAGLVGAASFLAFVPGVLFEWTSVARALPVVCLAAAAYWGADCVRRCGRPGLLARELPLVLFAVFGALLLTKMLLAARIEQYGFALAMPASLVLCVVLVRDLPDHSSHRSGEIARAAALGAVAAALVFFTSVSAGHYARKTLAVGEGGDRVLTWPRRGRPLAAALEALGRQLPSDASLLVMPEGASLNYWLRRVNPTPYTLFLPAELAAFGGEERMLEGIRRAPPDFIVLVNRPGGEFGVGPFGTDARFGLGLLEYAEAAYRRVARFGAEPFRGGLPGVAVMQRRAAGPGVQTP